MNELEIYITKKEEENFNKFLDKYLSSSVFKLNDEYYFKQKYKAKVNKCSISYNKIDFSDTNDFELLHQLITETVINTFELLQNNWSEEVEDFKYINADDTHIYYLLRHCEYGINDIFDFFSKLFISLLECHKLINGNKRFAYFFLINLVRFCGFYFKLSTSKKINIYKLKNERVVYCFVYKLQNRNYEDVINDYKNLNNSITDLTNADYLKKCIEEIRLKYENLPVKERQERTKTEIRNWIKKNIVISNNTEIITK
ncbi:hypothetical protein ACR82Z_01650 [Mycoplasma sp. 6243]|uniref:hypothetical protein n=1 Tax=Mycoplasma sp. 6243 TaxID=3440865 RepID=UPI003EBB02FF